MYCTALHNQKVSFVLEVHKSFVQPITRQQSQGHMVTGHMVTSVNSFSKYLQDSRPVIH